MELKKCPFCGSEPIKSDSYRQCSCSDPVCAGFQCWVSEESWNIRNLPDEVEQLIEAVNTFISASREDAETIIPAAEWGIMKQKLTACQHLRNKGE